MKTPTSKIIHDYAAKLWMICFVILLCVVLLFQGLAQFIIQFYTLHKTELKDFVLSIIYFLLPVMFLFILFALKDRQTRI